MSKSIEKDGFFGKYTEHYDDDGNKTGESRERDGVFGKYVEHTDASGNKTGESREREGFFGDYTQHTNTSGQKIGESREREGFFGDYTEHTSASGEKIGESRQREGFFGPYTEHTGPGWSRGDAKSYESSRESSGGGWSSSHARSYDNPRESPGEGWWVVPLVGLFIGLAIIIAIVMFAVFVVLPISLLNSAFGLAILAIFYKNRRTLFAALSLVGGLYLLVDVFAGWLSAVFVNNVVGNPLWITSFVYLNAAAVGLSTWFLIQPIWANSLAVKASDRNKGLLLMGSSIAMVAVAAVSLPLFYYLIPNTLGVRNSPPGISDTRAKGPAAGVPNGAGIRPGSNLDTGLTGSFNRSYTGTIGNQGFSLTLVREGNRLSGHASTAKNTDTLSGTVEPSGQFEMKGFENGERFTGIYKGTIFGNGTVEGSWMKPDGTKETAFSISQIQ